MTVNGLPLPHDLLALMAAGRWKPPADPARLSRLIPDGGGLYPYTVAEMERETQAWFRLPGVMLHGAADPDASPGDVDPRLTVFVADTGCGSDQPIALDYRASRAQPRVLTLRWSERGRRNRWVAIAPHILTFAELVGL